MRHHEGSCSSVQWVGGSTPSSSPEGLGGIGKHLKDEAVTASTGLWGQDQSLLQHQRGLLGVSIPGGVQGWGDVALRAVGTGVGLGTSEGFSSLHGCDPMRGRSCFGNLGRGHAAGQQGNQLMLSFWVSAELSVLFLTVSCGTKGTAQPSCQGSEPREQCGARRVSWDWGGGHSPELRAALCHRARLWGCCVGLGSVTPPGSVPGQGIPHNIIMAICSPVPSAPGLPPCCSVAQLWSCRRALLWGDARSQAVLSAELMCVTGIGLAKA